jgi:hypothetical protein
MIKAPDKETFCTKVMFIKTAMQQMSADVL